jgi:hypothetical protein
MGSDWVHPEFDDSTWTVGRGGVGYDQRPDYLELIEMDVKNKIHGKGTTLFARYQFETPELPHYDKLILRLKVEDGYAIFLNGTEVAREGFEGDPSWNSRAAPRSDQAAMQWHYIDLTAHAELLGKGSNVLAIWLINERAESSDLLLLPELYLEEVIPGSVVKASPDKGLLARTLLDGQWSPLYEFPAGAKNGSAKSAKPGSVVISEIMYHPAEPSESEVEAGFGKKSDFEFLELANVDKEAVDLAGVYCRKGIHLLVGSPLVVAPGERVILARNPDGFRQRYPKQKVAATYQGNLGNGSESITLRTASGAALGAVSYKDDSPWPEEADGEGYSLVLKKLSPEVDLDAAENWVASEKVGGSPGQP